MFSDLFTKIAFHKKMKFSVKDFFSNVTKSVQCSVHTY